MNLQSMNLQSIATTRWRRAFGDALLALGLLVLVGWATHSTFLTTWWVSSAAMAPLTAICFVLAGLGIRAPPADANTIGRYVGCAVLACGALSFMQFIFNRDFGLHWRLPDDQPGRFLMSGGTAAAFMLAGGSLMLRSSHPTMARAFAVLAGVIGASGALEFAVTLGDRHIPGLMSMSFPTAIGVVVLAAGLWMAVTADLPVLPLKVVLGALVTAALLPAFIFMLAQTRSMSEQRLEAIRSAGRDAADDIGRSIAARFAERIALLRALATAPALTATLPADGALPTAANLATFHAQARAAIAPSEGWLILTNSDGMSLLNSRRSVGDADLRPLDHLSSIAEAIRTGEPQLSNLTASRSRPDLKLLTISYQVPGRGLVLNFRLPVEGLSQQLKSIAAPDWTYAVADRDGLIIARNRNPEQWIGQHVTLSAWNQSRDAPAGWVTATNLEGVPVFTSWKLLPNGWTAFAGVGESSIDLAGRVQNRRLVLGTALMTALGLLFAALGAILLTRPLLRVSAVGDDGLKPQAHGIVAEINTLADALYRAASDRRRVTIALAENEAKLHRFVDQAPAAIAMFDRQMTYLAVSQRWVTYFGPQHSDLVGRSHYEVFADLPQSWRDVHQRGLNGEMLQADGDPFQRSDGRQMFVRWEIRPWHTVDGVIGGITIYADDVTERFVAVKSLRDSEARLKAIFDTATDAIVVTDARGRIENFNPAAEKLFDVAAAAAIGRPVSMLMDKASHDGILEGFRTLGVAEFEGFGREIAGRRSDGSMVPIDLSITRWSVDGKRYYTGIMRDITSRKERENHVRLVMRELSHRTKNALAVVQAMAWQTSRATKDVDAFQQQFTQRVDGLSRSIGLLVRNDWGGVGVRELVEGQLAPFLDEPSRLACDGPTLVLKPNAAQDLGLVLHELATNASKYGALSVPGGHVAARWYLQAGPDGRDDFCFDWRELGGPRVTEPGHVGFGSSLIRDMLFKTYKAKIKLDFDASGLVWCLLVDRDRMVTYDAHETTARIQLAKEAIDDR